MRATAVIAVVCLVLFGCGGGGETAGGTVTDDTGNGEAPEPASDDPIVGSWEVVEVLEGEDIDNTGTVYTFEADGSMTIEGGWTNEGSWSWSGDTLVVVFGTVEMPVLVTFDDGSLVYDLARGDQTFLMERR